jgi:hypothetical protein
MFPYIGHEFIAALLESPARKPDSVHMRRPSKRHDDMSTRPSLLAFCARHMEVLKAHANSYFFKQREEQATTKPVKSHISQMDKSNLPLLPADHRSTNHGRQTRQKKGHEAN